MTNLQKVRIRGVHLSLPGYENGPTLEVFQYEPQPLRSTEPQINGQGFGHLAFQVDVVEEVLQKLIEYGGKQLGEVIHKDYEGIGSLTAVYTRDPEGNLIEIQNWKK